jgi:hypothetical protein
VWGLLSLVDSTSIFCFSALKQHETENQNPNILRIRISLMPFSLLFVGLSVKNLNKKIRKAAVGSSIKSYLGFSNEYITFFHHSRRIGSGKLWCTHNRSDRAHEHAELLLLERPFCGNRQQGNLLLELNRSPISRMLLN